VKLLYQFKDISNEFVKVIPREYKRIVGRTKELERQGMSHDEAARRVFEMREAGV
jgi:glutamate synthase (ferredoxin)